MKSVDFKSFVIGGLLVLLILCVGGGIVPGAYQEYPQRFAIGVAGDHAFILDTSTGQTWGFGTSSGLVFTYTKPAEFFAPKTPFTGHGLPPEDPNQPNPR